VEKLVKNNKDVEIWTDLGWSKFDGVLEKGVQSLLLIKFVNGQSIQCTPEHEFYTEGLVKVQAKTLMNNHKIITDNHEITSIVSITEEASAAVYDIFNVEKNNRFYANDILVSNCEFVIYDETLIAPGILVDLTGVDPIERQGQVRWYEKPQKNHIYIVALDPSLGTGGDPAAIEVFDAKTMRQVAEWQHNLTIIQKQAGILAEICRYIKEVTNEPGNIYYSVENNTIGEAALSAIADIGEENIPGSFLSEPSNAGSRRWRKGFNTTPKSKIAACSKFKLWMETGKIKLCSKSLISELKTFVAHGVSYQGKTGETDDLVMATLLAVRMILHLRMYDSRISNNLTMDKEDIIPPMPFVVF